MSLFPPSRRTLPPTGPAVWRKLDADVLEERVYPAGRPPFHYFPSVHTVLNFVVCPVAGVHELFYGIDRSFIDPWTAGGSGKLFEGYVCLVKSKIARGELDVSFSATRRLYQEFSADRPENVATDCWRTYVSKWLAKNLAKLQRYHGARLASQVHCLTRIELEGRKYPILGEIDQIEMDPGKKIVEITILPDRYLPLKKFQAWLYWKMLCSVPPEHRPAPWRGENFEQYDIVVETPDGEVPVEKDNPEYVKGVHEAYAWIADLTSSTASLTVADAFKVGKEFCWDKNEKPVWCHLDTRWCMAHAPRFPKARRAMHHRIRRFYRDLLFEQMWRRHLFLYQMLELDPSTLGGKIASGKVVEVRGDEVIVQLDSPHTALQETSEDEEIRGFYGIFGTLHLGVIRRMYLLEELDENRLRLRVAGDVPISDINILPPDATLYHEPPWFLVRQKQRRMRAFERKRGADRKDKARRRYAIQFVEGAFGSKRLVGRREDV